MNLLFLFIILIPNYPQTDLSIIAQKDKWIRPRACIIGKVTYYKHESDGDEHLRLEDSKGNFVICEIIPELPMKNGIPKINNVIEIWGIVRWDEKHKWGELHPVIGWKLK